MRWHLQITEGPATGSQLELSTAFDFGRDETGFGSLGEDPTVSARHARVFPQPDGTWAITDLGSTNGTLVNGRPVEGVVRLADGDTIRLGGSALTMIATREPATGDRREDAPKVTDVGGKARAVTDATAPAAPAATDNYLTVAPKPPRDDGRPPPPRADPAEPSSGTGLILSLGERTLVPSTGLEIGSAATAGVLLDGPGVGARHARIDLDARGYYLTDLSSAHGTRVDGELLSGKARWLVSGDTIEVGPHRLRFVTGQATQTVAGVRTRPLDGRVVPLTAEQLALGRDPHNDVVLDDPNVSRFHAELVRVAAGWELRDVGSYHGTRLDGRLVTQATLAAGSELGIGAFRFLFDGAALVVRDDRGAQRLTADRVSLTVDGKQLLQPTTLELAAGEFVAIVGAVGAGKSTLLKILAGDSAPSTGRVLIGADPLAARLPEIGYVPQDEIVHADLRVLEALRFAAQLRLPPDSTSADVNAAVERVIGQLELDEKNGTLLALPVSRLSGGQRKRLAVATELVGNPGLVFLDEPTSGLDAGTEKHMMGLMRSLADGGRAIVMVTHIIGSLAFCDRVAVVGSGGVLCFAGPPAAALEFFDANGYDEIYDRVRDVEPVEWRARWTTSPYAPPVLELPPDSSPERSAAAAQTPSREQPGGDVWREHAAVLARRSALLLRRDRRYTRVLVAQVPILALAVVAVSNHRALESAASASKAAQVIFVMLTAVLWLGTTAAVREIVKERTVRERESAAGVSIRAYLASKVLVLFALGTAQALAFTAIVFALRPGGSGIVVILILVVTELVGVAIGLTISAFARTENQASSVVPIVLLIQLLFAGELFPTKTLPHAVGVLTGLVFERWSFQGAVAAEHVSSRFLHPTSQLGTSFMTLTPVVPILVLLVSIAALLAAVWWRLRADAPAARLAPRRRRAR